MKEKEERGEERSRGGGGDGERERGRDRGGRYNGREGGEHMSVYVCVLYVC